MSSPSPKGLEARKVAIASLRSNHRGYRKIQGYLKGGMSDRCASGVIAETFHVPIKSNNDSNATREVGKILEDEYAVSYIIGWNDDNDSSTFADIAEKLAVRWHLS